MTAIGGEVKRYMEAVAGQEQAFAGFPESGHSSPSSTIGRSCGGAAPTEATATSRDLGRGKEVILDSALKPRAEFFHLSYRAEKVVAVDVNQWAKE